MAHSALVLAQWQFTISWRLATEYHLPRLTDELCLWQPELLHAPPRPSVG